MLMIGKSLGNFDVSALIGHGGMGKVYRAKDQKLGRDVAIKVLPEEFAKDADRAARFQREAKLLASLNHPNIAAIYGLEESAGTNFLVLELVEGDTLADRIKAGPVPVEESLKLALQIAEALEAAHEKGVIHRDLKPANIKVTPDGKVKVLDFGLAKAFAGEQAELNVSNSPTLSNAATQRGVILGTAGYMSPEQARGETVDKRADIWAFGCVLFEMLTGRPTFEGRTASDILASVIKSEPGWDRLPPNLHPRIRLLLERCLEKEAKNRCSGIGDARVDIWKALAEPAGMFVQPITAKKHRTKLRTILPWVAAAIAMGAILAGVVVWKLKTPESLQITRLSYELPGDQHFGNLYECAVTVSRDGKQMVYSASGGLYVRSMNEWNARLIPNTENAQNPFFSPDGNWVGYRSGDQLMKIATSGGAPVRLADAPTFGFCDWGADDTIVYGQTGKGIMRVSANGGAPDAIVKEEKGIIFSPQILPGGKSVLFTRTSPAPVSIMVQSLESGERKELFQGDTARYLPTGHILYHYASAGENLFVVPFDPDNLRVTGRSIPVVEGVYSVPAPQYSVSDSGTFVYIPQAPIGTALSQRNLVWVDRQGKEESIAAAPDNYSDPKISPDGARLAVTIQNASGSSIWIWDLARKTPTRLTLDENSVRPLWTRDGKRIAFASYRTGTRTYSTFWRAADGEGEDELLGPGSGARVIPWSWSRDGKTLVLFDWHGLTKMNILALPIGGDRQYRPLLHGEHMEAQPEVSPDGRWMAYISDESGQLEIYVRPFPEVSKGRWQVSTHGGHSPLWSPDGRELFYRGTDSVMAVAVQTEPTFKPGTTEVLFKDRYVPLSSQTMQILRPWDINPDGKRFLMMKSAGSGEAPTTITAQRKINIVLNWFEELKQRVPTR